MLVKEEDNIKKAIEMGHIDMYSTAHNGKITCYSKDYLKRIDLTIEEYKVYKKIIKLTKREKLSRLAKCMDKTKR